MFVSVVRNWGIMLSEEGKKQRNQVPLFVSKDICRGRGVMLLTKGGKLTSLIAGPEIERKLPPFLSKQKKSKSGCAERKILFFVLAVSQNLG